MRSALCISNLTPRAPRRFHAPSSGALLRFPFPMTCVVCMRAHCVYAIVYGRPRALLFPLLPFIVTSFAPVPLCRGEAGAGHRISKGEFLARGRRSRPKDRVAWKRQTASSCHLPTFQLSSRFEVVNRTPLPPVELHDTAAHND